jgi:HEAT repeat protein
VQDVSGGLGILTTDGQLSVRSWNGWLAAATGLPESAVQGRSLLDVAGAGPDSATAELLAEVLATGGSRVLASAFHHYLIPCAPTVPSPHFPRMQQRVTVAALTTEAGIAGLMVTVEDVTARRDAERQLAASLDAGVEPVPSAAVVAAVGADDWRLRGAAVRALRQSATRDEIAHLLETLQRDHHDLNVLSSALQVLIAANRDVTAPLVQLLADPAANLRMHAALALGALDDPAAVPALVGALDDEDANVRFHAIEALGQMRASEAVEPLARIAGSGDFFLSFPAIDALGRIDDAGVVPTLIGLLDQELLRPAVIDSLAALGDEDCVAPLVQRLNAGDREAGPIAAALARIHARYDHAYDAGVHIVELARRAIRPEGIGVLAEAVQQRRAPLASLVTVLGWMGRGGTAALVSVLGESGIEAPLADAMAGLGAAAVDPVIERFRSGGRDGRLAAAALLGRLGDRRAVPALIEALSEADDDLVGAAAASLASLGDPRALDSLLPLFAHTNAAVRQAAIAAVNSIGAEGTAARVRARVADPDPRVRECAIRVAAYFGFDGAAASVLDALDDQSADVRRAAIEQLPVLEDPRAMARLLGALRDESPRNRAAAAHALRAADDDTGAEGALIGALDDVDPWVRYFAAASLAAQGGRAAVDALARTAAADAAPHVRITALQTIAVLDPDAVVPLAARYVGEPDDDLACAAVAALAGVAGGGADDLLERAAHDVRVPVRAAAIQALAARGSVRAPGMLAWAARTTDSPALAGAAIDALRRIAAAPDAPGGDGALATLLELGAVPDRRESIVAAIAALPTHAVDTLGAALSSPHAGVRHVVVEALARMRHPRASAALARALADEDASIRTAAVAAFGRLGTPGVAVAVSRLRQSDPDAGVRRRAAAVCQRHGWGGGPAGERP